MDKNISSIKKELKAVRKNAAKLAEKSDDLLDKEITLRLQVKTSNLYELVALIDEALIHIENNF